MRRRLFNLLAGVSMILFLATLALWVRSHWRWYHCQCSHKVGHVGFPGEEKSRVAGAVYWGVEADCTGGRLLFQRDSPWVSTIESAKWKFSYESGLPGTLITRDDTIWNRLGFEVYEDPMGFDSGVIMPIWPITLLAAFLPAAWITKRYRRRRQTHCCEGCGYDLRATPDRCPECGLVRQSSSG